MNLKKQKENLFGFTKSGLYCITCFSTNKHYIGESSNVKARLNAHLNLLRRKIHSNKELQNDFINYGESNFNFQNLIFGTSCDLKQRRYLESVILLTLSPETRYNIYINRKPIQEKNPFFNKRHTIEARTLQSLAKKGRLSSFKNHQQKNEVKEMISRINSNKSVVERRKPVIIDNVYYESISEASEKTKYNRRIIRERCHNKAIKNFKWANSNHFKK